MAYKGGPFGHGRVAYPLQWIGGKIFTGNHGFTMKKKRLSCRLSKALWQTNIAIEAMAIEIVGIYLAIKWWFSSSQTVSLTEGIIQG
jgi:hypothetical protein